MAKRQRNEPVAEDESWLITYADAITLLMAFFVMLLSFSEINPAAFESVMAGIKNELGQREAPVRPLFNLAQNLNQIIDETDISPSLVESGFDELGVVIEFESRSFFAPGSAVLLPQAKTILIEIAFELEQPPYDLYFVDIEGHTDDSPINTPPGRANVPGVAGWEIVVENMGTVPQVALGLGSVAGLGAAHLAASHYSVMIKDRSAMFIAGPPIVEGIGQKLTKNELGGYKIQLRAGAVDHAVATEEEAFECARRFLSYLPSSVHELPPRGEQHDDPARRSEWLIDAIPRDIRKVYKMRPIIEAVVDEGSFFEMGRRYGRSFITGLARLDGWPVAVMASDPYSYGGAWTADTCRKVAKFVDLAETFHLPVVYLVDCPGFLVGKEAEETGTIKEGVRAMSAIWQTTMPWCAMIIRNVFGVAGAAHRNGGRFCTRHAWPSGRWGSLPLEGGIEAAYRADLDAALDRDAKLAEIQDRLNQLRSPFRSAESFWIEEIVDPRDTRTLLCDFANTAAPLREAGQYRHMMRP